MADHDRAEDESVTDWIVQLRAGDADAAQRLWERYYERLTRTARSWLGATPRRAFDEEDIALLAFEKFLRGVEQQRFPRLDDRDDLWRLLLTLTRRAASNARAEALRLKRGGGQVRGESAFANANEPDQDGPGLQGFADDEPTPAACAMTAETMARLLGQLDEPLRALALAKLEGYSNQEMAEKFAVSLRSIERKLSIIRSIWERE